MDITPQAPASGQIIQAYGDGGFRISQVRHEGPVLVLPDRVLPWPVDAVADVTADSLMPLQEGPVDVELLLIGCGASIAVVPGPAREALRTWGIVIEPMDTGAACRTYNVLLLEGRRVAAALLPVA